MYALLKASLCAGQKDNNPALWGWYFIYREKAKSGGCL